jgi:Zn finger protein HypA/HybF involved in hydrogenase expression
MSLETKRESKLTKSEQLLRKVGQPVECDFCHKNQPFARNWMMTSKKEVVCPKCQDKVLKSGELMVSI